MGAWDRVPVIEISCGREGLWGLRNRSLIPIHGLVQLRNATLEDHSWRTGGGAAQVGSAISGAPTIQAAIDFWPDTGTQRTLTSDGAGVIRKDDGAFGTQTALVSGLTTGGQVPMFVAGGAESSGRSRKCFHFDRVNAVRVLAADGATMSVIANPPTAWSGANQPGVGAVHQGYLWAAGAANDPHRLHRSLAADHEDFTTTIYTLLIDPGVGERIVALLSYKGGLLVWKFPRGVWFVDTSNATPANWRAFQVGEAGTIGPGTVVAAEDDVVWLDPFGGWHLISATEVTGSVRATDISQRKLGSVFRDQVNLAQLATAQMVYYSQKQEILVACHGQGGTAKNRRFHLDIGRRQDVGERWIYWDRDRNEALFMRKVSGVEIPAFADNAGRLYNLDRVDRNAGGAAFTFEWFTKPTDFGEVVPAWRGRVKNLRFLQLEYDPRSSGTHGVQVYADGSLRNTVSFTLSTGPTALPVTLPVTLGVDLLRTTIRRRLYGQATSIALRGVSSVLNQDVSLTRVLLGLELAA